MKYTYGMKCKCGKEMIAQHSGRVHYVDCTTYETVYWCNACGRTVTTYLDQNARKCEDWYEPDSGGRRMNLVLWIVGLLSLGIIGFTIWFCIQLLGKF